MEKKPGINNQRTITWVGEIDEDNLKRVLNKITNLLQDEEIEPIHLILHSSGGYSRRGHAFYDFIRAMSVPLHTYGIGFVDSAAIIVFLSGIKRFVSPHTTMLLHGPTQDFGKTDSVLIRDLQLAKADLQKEHQDDIRIIQARIGQTLSKQRLLTMHRRTTNLSAEEIVKYGFAHELWKQPES